MREIVFAVFREGVYRHECLGVYTDRDPAVDRALAVARAEPDGYHEIHVRGFVLNEDDNKDGEIVYACAKGRSCAHKVFAEDDK